MTQTRPSCRPVSTRTPGQEMRLFGSAARFAVVGVGGVLVNMAALHLLYGVAEIPLLLASPVAVELAIVHNYLLNDRWTFHGRGPSMARFVAFNLGAVLALLVNVASVLVLVASGAHYLVANLIGIGAGAALNFCVSAGWVWRVWP